MYKFQVVRLLLINFLVINDCLGEDLDYKITVPESACSDKEDKEIKITGKDASKVTFLWSLYFKEGEKDCDNIQRCNLMIWKNVRALESIINNALKENATLEGGVVKIPYKMLMPGVTYELNVTVSNNGSEVGKNHFTLRCDGNKEKLNDKMQSCSVSLKGSNLTYVDMTYYVLAEVAFCGTTNYTLSWELFDSTQTLLRSDNKKGNAFKIAPKTFNAGSNYVVKCAVELNNGTVMTRAVQTVNVLKRNLQVKLAISRLIIGLKQPLKINSFVADPDFLPGKVELQWSCVNEKMELCDKFDSSNNTELELSKGFETVGTYQIMLTALKGDSKSTSQNATIIVIINPVHVIEVEPSDFKYGISDTIEIRATANDLVYGCTLQWTSVTNQTGYEQLDMKTVPGNVDRIIKIQSKEDTMLYELVEHSNDTVDKEIDLILPPPEGAWVGLKGNANYLFRLVVKCPRILIEDDTASKKEPVVEDPDIPVIFYVDVPISTKSPPTLKSFTVNPVVGNAFETEFRYITTAAKDEDIPILYKFGYLVNNNPIYLLNSFETIEANLILPYIKNPVESFIEVCDSTNACANTVGPRLTVSLPNDVNWDKIKNLLKTLKSQLNEREFYKAFIGSASILQFLRENEKIDLLNMTKISIENITNNVILNLLNSKEMDLNWRMETNDFVKHIKILATEMNLSEYTLQNLIVLRNKMAGTEMVTSNATVKLPINKSKPTKLSMPLMHRNKETTLGAVKDAIEFSEMITSTSTNVSQIYEEKSQLVTYIRSSMAQLCASLYSKSQLINIGTKTVQFSIQRMHKSHFNNFMSIPYENNNKTTAEIKLGKAMNEILKTRKNLCLGKTVFYGYLNITTACFGTEIFSANTLESIQVTNKDQYNINIILPAPNVIENVNCAYLENDAWNVNHCSTEMVKEGKVYCKCNTLGFYSVVYSNETKPTTFSIEKPTESPLTSSLIPTITKSSMTMSLNEITAISHSKGFTKTVYLKNNTENTISPTTVPIIKLSTEKSQEISKNHQATFIHSTESVTVPNNKNSSIPKDVELIENNSTNSNITKADIAESSTTSYVLIGISLVGIALLTVATKRMLLNNENQALPVIARPVTISSHEFDPIGWPRYARLHAEENLQDPAEDED